ncbi:hypothetical protein SEA_TENNO_47 [Arthrobacter phage Tenno]|uniref:Uncharacterized protein n=1 Tax=Arthrobacter phage Tenno TaxID=2315702 RepID=A0A386KSG7_9CAUD|nr:hypothetical protein SEA_TENNO_47 [Arthrobacter phage Tenno]
MVIEPVTDDQINAFMDLRPQLTPEYMKTAQKCDVEWETGDPKNPEIHECSRVLGEKHVHICIDCDQEK